MYQQAVQAAQCHQATIGVGDGGSGSQSSNAGGPVFLPLFMNPQTNPSMQYLSVPHPATAAMQHSTMTNAMMMSTQPSNLPGAKLGPVERAVLTQVLGDSRPHKRKIQLRCETCSVSFNSQGQADTHYRGKRHARITEIRRRKSQKQMSEQKEELAVDSGNSSEENGLATGASELEKTLNVGDTDSKTGNEINTDGQSSSQEGAPGTSSEADRHPGSNTLDSTIQKFCNAERNGEQVVISNLDDKIELREETEEEKQARLEMEAEVKKMLENLPPYVKRVVRAVKPLDENMHCKECDVWVNSDTQMKQHLGSLRHKNTIAGIPVPPRPDKIEPIKPRSNHQYKCELCNVTLNSEVQLLQHLRSQRHKATLEGKPPKPRWVPYERFREQQRIQAKLKIQAHAYANPSYQPVFFPQMTQMAQMPQMTAAGTMGQMPGMQFVQLM